MISYSKSRWMLVLLLSLWGVACSTEITTPKTEPAKETAKPDPLKQPPASVVTSGEVKIPEASVQSPNTPPESPSAGEVKSSSAPLEASKDRSDRACQNRVAHVSSCCRADRNPEASLPRWPMLVGFPRNGGRRTSRTGWPMATPFVVSFDQHTRYMVRTGRTARNWRSNGFSALFIHSPKQHHPRRHQRHRHPTLRSRGHPFLKHYAEGRLFDHNRAIRN